MARTPTARNSLSLEDLAAIAAAPPDATPAELARRLGRPRELALATRYFESLPEARRAALFAKWRATGRRDYQITLAVADQRGAPWTEDDDRYILATMKAPARELGLALGRTSWAVYRRRQKLRRRLETEAGKAMRRTKRGK